MKNSWCSIIIFLVIFLALFSKNTLAEEIILHRAIEDVNNQALHNFYKSFSNTLLKNNNENSGITRIIHYGDSHIAADILTSELRNRFQQQLGNAGNGFILTGKPWSWYARKDVNTTISSAWQTNGLSQTQLPNDGKLGLAGISFTTDQVGQYSSLTANGRFFDIYLMKQPSGGTIEVLLDGAKYRHRVSLLSEGYEPSYVPIDAGTNGHHTIEIKTIRAGQVRVFGIDVRQDQAGVIYDALGINGARASRLSLWDWDILKSNLAYAKPNLVIIAYGSNEVTDPDLDLVQYKKDFATFLQKFHQAVPQAALLVISPPDRAIQVAGRWQSVSNMPALVEAQRQAALANGAAFWNLFQAMGGAGSINKWANWPTPLAQADHVHLTKAGYQLVAQTFYQELTKGYFRYLYQDFLTQQPSKKKVLMRALCY